MDYVLAFCLAAVGCAVFALYQFLRRIERGDIQLYAHPAKTCHPVYPKDEAELVTSRNPWSLSVSKNGHSVNILSLIPFSVQCYLEVDASSLEDVISAGNIKEREFLHRRHDLQRFLANSCKRQDILMPNAAPGEHTVLPQAGADTSPFSGTVVILVLAASPDDARSEYDAAALVAVLSVQPSSGKPAACRYQVDSQWVMNYHAATCRLQTLFVSGDQLLRGESTTASTDSRPCNVPLYASHPAEDSTTTKGSAPPRAACVVCQMNEATEALLPCRHVALCTNCLTRVGLCPVCRSAVQSHFTVVS